MNSEEFRNEVLNSGISPANFDEIYNEYVKYQNIALDTLNEFHRICEKYGIDYQLAFGSLLGAIRDNGVIPWDYDIDVFVPYEQKDKLISVLNSHLSPNYYFTCPENNKNCNHYFMRISPWNFESWKLHIDVYYLVGLPDNSDIRTDYLYLFQKYLNYRHKKNKDINSIPWNMVKTKIDSIFNKILLFPISIKYVDKKINRLFSETSFKDSNLCYPTLNSYKGLIFNTCDMIKTKIITTSFGEYRVPTEYDKILRIVYNDYNKIFPLTFRLNEMINNYNILTNNKIKFIGTNSKRRYYIE